MKDFDELHISRFWGNKELHMQTWQTWWSNKNGGIYDMAGAVKTFNPESMFVINDSTVSGGFAPHLQHV